MTEKWKTVDDLYEEFYGKNTSDKRRCDIINVLSKQDSFVDKQVLPKTSFVDHPPHYGGSNNPYEAIKVIEAWQLDFNLGNVVKYISRSGKKTPDRLTDLEKALWYLQREINNERVK